MSALAAFPADVAIADFSGPCEILFEASSATIAPELIRIGDTFEAAAQAGMFSVGTAPSVQPLLILENGDRPSSRVRRRWRCEGVRPGAYRVLLNMLDASQQASGAIEQVRLLSLEDRGGILGRGELLGVPYPASDSAPPFTVRVLRNIEDSNEPVIRIEFDVEVGDDLAALLAAQFQAWDGLVLRGGFLRDPEQREPAEQIDAIIAAQQTYVASQRSIEHLFYEYVGPRQSYGALVNMCARLHAGIQRIAALEIE